MSDSTKKFVVDMSAFVKKAKGNMDQIVRKVVIDIGAKVIMRSPVGDGTLWKHPPPPGYVGGRFRGNWMYGETVAPKGTTGAIDPSGRTSISRILVGLKPDAAGKVHYLVNNLPYAMRLETGWSKQAPGGMVGLAVAEFAGTVARISAEVKSSS